MPLKAFGKVVATQMNSKIIFLKLICSIAFGKEFPLLTLEVGSTMMACWRASHQFMVTTKQCTIQSQLNVLAALASSGATRSSGAAINATGARFSGAELLQHTKKSTIQINDTMESIDVEHEDNPQASWSRGFLANHKLPPTNNCSSPFQIP